MEINKELQDFLNDDDVLDLIADQDWAELFSWAENNDEMVWEISDLHKTLVKSGVVSTNQILYTVDHIPACFFAEFDDLTSITIPNNITKIGGFAFCRCKNLTSVAIPDSVTGIDEVAFSECDSLTSITIPDSVTTIGYDAFSDCPRLTNITFGENSALTHIGYAAFKGCSSLTDITIPSGVTTIDKDAFQDCNKLKTIYFNGTQKQWKRVKKATDWIGSKDQIKVICTG